jgi:hypothetical protein
VHLAVPLIGFALVAYYALVQHNYGFALWTAPNALVEQGRQAAAFVQSPQGWLDSLRAEDAKVAERIRAAQPLPPLRGSVDAISNVQASVIAAGLDFTPRPTLQENMTVSPPLIARNRAFLEGRNAPDHLIFAPGATDKRHPASIEGSLWPLLLSRYDIAGETSGGRLVLDKRGEPRDVELTAGAPQHATFGQEIAMPGGTTPLFLKLDIRETTVGKLVEQAYKPPLVYLTVSYASGKPETYRLIPGMIREGMVIAPTVATAADYEALASGKSDTLRFPTSIRIDTPGRWAYDPEIDVTFETIAIPAN